MNNTTRYCNVLEGNSIKIPFLVALAGAIIVLAAFFLPYASATKEHRDFLERYSQEMNIAEIGMTNKDAIHISLFEFAKMYGVIYNSIDKALGLIIIVIIGTTGVLSLLTLLFTVLKKPIGMIIFDSLTLGSFYILTWDYKDRGAMPNSNYNWGISHFLYYIGAFVILISAIWLLVVKIRLKQHKKAENTVND